MARAIYNPPSLVDLAAEADRRTIELLQAIKRTRALLEENQHLLAPYSADLAMRQHLERDAVGAHTAARPN